MEDFGAVVLRKTVRRLLEVQMREKDIEARCKKLAEAEGGRLYKWISPGCDGVPDRILILPGGYLAFVEFKAWGKRPTAQQERRHQELRELGQTVHVVYSVEDFSWILRLAPYEKR